MTRTPKARPSCSISRAGHLDGAPSGGSATIRRPPRARNGDPHSAVTAGAPNPRDVTASNVPLSAPRAACSARSAVTRTRWDRSRTSTACRRNVDRVTLPSSSVQWISGRASARTSPGTPPPLPRSSASRQPSDSKVSIGNACSMWVPTGPGPTKPRCFAPSSTAVRPASCSGGRAGELRGVGWLTAVNQSGRTTTRRLGSSPSEMVWTPSISAIAS